MKLSKYSGKEFRTIDGKKYKFEHAHHLKSNAKTMAESYRQQGKKVRVIPFIGGYGVFVR